MGPKVGELEPITIRLELTVLGIEGLMQRKTIAAETDDLYNSSAGFLATLLQESP